MCCPQQLLLLLAVGLPACLALGRLGPTGIHNANQVGPDLERKNFITDEVTFTVQIGRGKHAYRNNFTLGVFGDIVPMTAYNFLLLCRGYHHRDQNWKYNGTQVHRIVPDMLVQMGDVLFGDGRSGRAVFSPYFIDENFVHQHRTAGYAAMANSGPDTNGSQFYITLARARWLDGRNVVFGKLIEGMKCLRRLTEIRTNENGYPSERVTIVNVVINHLKEPYELTKDELVSPIAPRDKDPKPEL